MIATITWRWNPFGNQPSNIIRSLRKAFSNKRLSDWPIQALLGSLTNGSVLAKSCESFSFLLKNPINRKIQTDKYKGSNKQNWTRH